MSSIPPTTEIYTLSLHDALPISREQQPTNHGALLRRYPARARGRPWSGRRQPPSRSPHLRRVAASRDRKSTRLNSSHTVISYAVFCLKKKIVLRQDTLVS